MISEKKGHPEYVRHLSDHTCSWSHISRINSDITELMPRALERTLAVGDDVLGSDQRVQQSASRQQSYAILDPYKSTLRDSKTVATRLSKLLFPAARSDMCIERVRSKAVSFSK